MRIGDDALADAKEFAITPALGTCGGVLIEH
jgi:hypothetical protein